MTRRKRESQLYKGMSMSANWIVAIEAWNGFVTKHPELGYREGKWPFHNFLRLFRRHLVSADAIRLARGRHWIADPERFNEVSFECATGRLTTEGF